MFETLRSMFNETKNFFRKGYDYVVEKVHNAYDYITSGAKKVIEAPKHIAETLYGDGKSLIRGIDRDLNRVLDRGTETINNVVHESGQVIQGGQKTIGSTISNLGESLSMPLVIGIAIVGGILLLKK